MCEVEAESCAAWRGSGGTNGPDRFGQAPGRRSAAADQGTFQALARQLTSQAGRYALSRPDLKGHSRLKRRSAPVSSRRCPMSHSVFLFALSLSELWTEHPLGTI